MCLHKMGKKEDLGKYRPVGLPQFVGMLMNKSSSKTFKHMKSNSSLGTSSVNFPREKSYPADLIAFYEMPVCVAKWRTTNVVHLDFSKAFGVMSYSIAKVVRYGLGK